MIARKTVNKNFLIHDDRVKEYRFVDEKGFHIRWVTTDEADYLCKVIEPEEYDLVVDNPSPPIVKIIWQHIVVPPKPELSNNGGSYAFLHRVEKLEGWGDGVDGIRLVTNHLYGSDYEEDGWNLSEYFPSETEAWDYIENFGGKVA
jgi:hypothetical protein